MKLKKTTSILSVFYLLILITAVFDTFVNRGAQGREFAVFAQAVVLIISLLYLYKNYAVKGIHITGFHNALLIFVLMLTGYGIFSSHVDRLPVCLLAVSSFFLFYYAAYTDLINFRHIQYFAIILLIIYAYQTYLGIIYRTTQFDVFYVKADNTGYRAIYLMLVFALFIKNIRYILLFSLVFLLVIVSLKRGAILIGVLLYLIGLWPVIIGKIKINKKAFRVVRLGTIIIIALLVYGAIAYWDVISYRFVTDITGSGRITMYSDIYEAWVSGDAINEMFGFGFYQVANLLGSRGDILTYAHSDLQLLYDHGLLGFFIYAILFISFVKNRKIIKKYSPKYYSLFLMAICAWVLKSIYSGIYMNKDSVILFMAIGIVLGTTFREKTKQV